MTIRVFEAFSGVGSQRMALRNLGIDHEVVAISDVDEFTIKSYAAIHNNDKTVPEATDEEMQEYLEKRNIPLNDKGVRKILKGKKLKEFYEASVKSNNLGDISKVVTQDIPDHDLFTYSFPCQDISVAGKGSGLDEGSDTRSGLLWECQKVIYGKRPKYLLLENVKNLVGKKHKHNFDKWLEWLEKQGYTNYWQVLNAKDYGVPQNRERVFVVSILGHHDPYEFPEPIELELRLKDVLEDEVDEKYYLDNEKANKLISTVASKHEINEPTPTDGGLKKPKPKDIANAIIARYDAGISNQQSTGTMVIEPNVLTPKRTEYGKAIRKDYEKGLIKESRHNMTEMRPRTDGVSNTLTTVLKDNYVVEPKAERIGGIFDKDGTKHQAGAVWDKEQLAPTLDTMQGGWRQPSVVVDNSNIKPIKNEVVPEVIGGVGEKNFGSQFRQGNRVYDVNKIATALTASPVGNAGGHTPLYGDSEVFKTAVLPVVEPKEDIDTELMVKIQEKMMLTDDELEYGVLKQELFDKFGTSRVCTKCKSQVLHSDLPNYDYLCFECDENLYEFETESVHFLIGSTQKNAGITDGDYATTLTSAMGSGGGHVPMHNITSNLRIRKLTPKECWRLMGFSDDDFHKAEAVNSNSQLYKQAGNSIVVDVLEGIFKQLLEE